MKGIMSCWRMEVGRRRKRRRRFAIGAAHCCDDIYDFLVYVWGVGLISCGG